MSAVHPIDAGWRSDNPLPSVGQGTDKDSRGRVVIAGGSRFVPGALALTAEAALRAGAGKVQVATIAGAALLLGIRLPEAAMIALPEDDEGEIARDAAATLIKSVGRCDTLIFGPGMSTRPHTADLVAEVLEQVGGEARVLLDAGALTALSDKAAAVRALEGRCVMTPHHGELATLMGREKEAVAAAPEEHAAEAASRFNAVVALKGQATIVAHPDGRLISHSSDAPGLGTAGSGDVLAGVIGGLLARGSDPMCAAGWGVWLHGRAGEAAGLHVAPLGFLARELVREVAPLMGSQTVR